MSETGEANKTWQITGVVGRLEGGTRPKESQQKKGRGDKRRFSPCERKKKTVKVSSPKKDNRRLATEDSRTETRKSGEVVNHMRKGRTTERVTGIWGETSGVVRDKKGGGVPSRTWGNKDCYI